MSQKSDNNTQQTAANTQSQPAATSSGLSLRAAAFTFKPIGVSQPFAQEVQGMPAMGANDALPSANAPAPPSNAGSSSTTAAPSKMSLAGKPFKPQQNPTSQMSQSAVPFIPSKAQAPVTNGGVSLPGITNGGHDQNVTQAKFDQLYSGKNQIEQTQGGSNPSIQSNGFSNMSQMQQQPLVAPQQQLQTQQPWPLQHHTIAQPHTWNQQSAGEFGQSFNGQQLNNMSQPPYPNVYQNTNGYPSQMTNGQMHQSYGVQAGFGAHQGVPASFNSQPINGNFPGQPPYNSQSSFNNNQGMYNQPIRQHHGGHHAQRGQYEHNKAYINDHHTKGGFKQNHGHYHESKQNQVRNGKGSNHYKQKDSANDGKNNRQHQSYKGQSFKPSPGAEGNQSTGIDGLATPIGEVYIDHKVKKQSNLPPPPPQQPLALKVVGSAFTPFIPTAKSNYPKATAQEASKAPPPPLVEKQAESPKKKLFITGQDETKRTETLLEELRKYRTANQGRIGLELLKRVGELRCCQTSEDDGHKKTMTRYLNLNMIGRDAVQIHERRKTNNRQGAYNNNSNKLGNNFDTNTGKPNHLKQSPNKEGNWKPADSEQKTALKEAAKAHRERTILPKNEAQKVKLILNVIAPDNYEKKFTELRGFLFPGLKTRTECFDEEIEYDEHEHKLQEDVINVEILDTIVKNTFKKAIREKGYCIFYGELCEKMMKLELDLMGLDVKVGNMSSSAFRKQLLVECRQTFEAFFNVEMRNKETADDEKRANFVEKLFGNMEFVGELFRRRILPIKTLLMIFGSLLGITETNKIGIDDLIVEAAINLMNKVGAKFEEESTKKKTKSDSNLNEDQFDQIFNEFKRIMNSKEEENQISNRIKILIKNLFSNKDSNWEKTKQLNEGGPQTKAEVEKEVRDKYEKEQQKHLDSRKPAERRDNRGYHNESRRETDGRRKDAQVYQKKPPQPSQHSKRNDGGAVYGKGAKEPRNNERNNRRNDKGYSPEERKIEIIQISAEALLEISLKNFETYESSSKLAELAEPEQEDLDAVKDKRTHDFDFIKALKSQNGRPGSDVLFALAQGVLCEKDEATLDKYFKPYYDQIIRERHLEAKDFAQGLSKIISNLAELVMDCPKLHQVVFKYLMLPLIEANVLRHQHFRALQWDQKPVGKDQDEDEVLYEETDAQFKLVALILVNRRSHNHAHKSWSEIVKWFETELPWKKVFAEKYEKLESQGVFDDIRHEIGVEAASIIIPLLDQDKADSKGNQGKLLKALAKAK